MGVGFEYGFAPNWLVGLEYDHLFMGDANNSFSVVNPIAAAFVNNRISQDVDLKVTVRFNYRFGGYSLAPRSQRDTDLALFRHLQQTRSAEMPTFLLEVTCLIKIIRSANRPHSRPRQAAADGINRAPEEVGYRRNLSRHWRRHPSVPYL